MIRFISLILTVFLIFPHQANTADFVPSSFSDIVKKASPAVVNISTTQKVDNRKKKFSLNELPDNPLDLFEFFEEQYGPRKQRKVASLGSGFIIDPEGYIVTNYHIIADSDSVEVTLSEDNQQSYQAKVIGKDQKTDMALLKINSKKPLPYVKFGNSEDSEVGDWVIAIGNPFGLGGTVTAGIISAKARYLNNSQYDDFIQTDASINRGNSGGPMFNLKGEVIGVNTLILSTSGGSMGIGFAIPSATVEPIVEQLKAKGEIVRGWLGVKIQYIDENIAKALSIPHTKGALVAEVAKDSPAEKAGIRVGDIITRFNGKEVPNINKLPKMVAETPIGKKVSIQVFRNGKYEVLSTVIERPLEDGNAEALDEPDTIDENEKLGQVVLGVRVADLDNALRKRYKVDKSVNGVIVLGVNRNSPAIEIGLAIGDIIQQVNRTRIMNVKDFDDAINKLKNNNQKKALLLVHRGSESRFVVIELE
jgi:serine protease Do